MRFVQDTTLRLKQHKIEEFQEWVIANRARVEADYPEGMSLFGMFVTILGPGEGELHMLEILDSYAAMDRMAAHVKSAESRALGAEFLSFIDCSAPSSTKLMKDVVDASVMNRPAEDAKDLVLA